MKYVAARRELKLFTPTGVQEVVSGVRHDTPAAAIREALEAGISQSEAVALALSGGSVMYFCSVSDSVAANSLLRDDRGRLYPVGSTSHGKPVDKWLTNSLTDEVCPWQVGTPSK